MFDTSVAGTAYTSGAPDFTWLHFRIFRGSFYLILSFCVVIFGSMYCLSFFDLRLLITLEGIFKLFFSFSFLFYFLSYSLTSIVIHINRYFVTFTLEVIEIVSTRVQNKKVSEELDIKIKIEIIRNALFKQFHKYNCTWT